MKKILLLGLIALQSFSVSAMDIQSVRCYAEVKCPENAHCISREISFDLINGMYPVNIKAESMWLTEKKITNFRVKGNKLKVKGTEAAGGIFSATIDLEKLKSANGYQVNGKFRILRLVPQKLLCRAE